MSNVTESQTVLEDPLYNLPCDDKKKNTKAKMPKAKKSNKPPLSRGRAGKPPDSSFF